jgi:hypothetical protein
MGRKGLGSMNENGKMFRDLCNSNNLVIDHMTTNRTWRSLLDVRVMRGAEARSDHYLVKATLKIKLLASKKHLSNANRVRHRTERLKDSQVRRNFCLELRNSFQPLMDEDGWIKKKKKEKRRRKRGRRKK